MSTEETPHFNLDLPVPGTEKGTWGAILNEYLVTLEGKVAVAVVKPISLPVRVPSILGYIDSVISGQSSSPLNVNSGVGHLVIDINAGADLQGSLSVTGASYNIYDDSQTSRSETLTIEGTGAYITQAVFIGSCTIEYSNLTISDYDVRSAMPWSNRGKPFSIRSWELSGYNNNSAATATATLYRTNTQSGKLETTQVAVLEVTTTPSVNMTWRKGKTLLTSSVTPQYEGIVITTTVSSLSHWDGLNVILELEER